MNEPTEIIVKFLRLNSGEDIVCETQTITEKTIKVIKPLKIVYTLSEHTGMLSVSLLQWVFPKISETESFDLDLHNIVVSSDASVDMTAYYYRSLDKIEKTISVSKKYKQAMIEENYEDEFIDEDIGDDALDYVKEMMEEVIKKSRRLH